MAWTVEWDERAVREFSKLDKPLQIGILKYLRECIAVDADPRRFGKPLSYDKHGLWRYRVQDARVICRIEEEKLIVLVVRVAHRKTVYAF